MSMQSVISQGADLRDLAGSPEVSGLALELLATQVGTRGGGFLRPLSVPLWLIVIQHFVQSMVVAEEF